MDGLLSTLERGESAVALLLGEPGIGKTTLLTEALRGGVQRGYMALAGRAVEIERDLPFGLFADALEEELGASGPDLGLAIEDATMLATVFSSLGRGCQATDPPTDTLADERHRMLGAIQALLGALSAGRPLVLALDDLHWADSASIDLVCRLLHRGFAKPSLLLLAMRTRTEPRLLSAFEDAERRGQAQRIELLPLSATDAYGLIGTEIDPVLRETIYRESGGNPFYLQQLCRVARRGPTSPCVRTGLGDLDDLGELGIPAAVGTAVRGELDRLATPARMLLAGAALLGEPFEPSLAAATAGLQEADVPDALDELRDADLVRSADSLGCFSFRHPIVRHAVYVSAGAGWRLAAHARAAEALEQAQAPPVVRAPHVARSARVGDQAAAELLAKAAHEMTVPAPASAARWLEAALRLIPHRDDNLELRLGLLLQRAAVLSSAGQIESSRETFTEFLTLSPPQPNARRANAAIFAAILDELLGNHEAGRRLLLDELSRLDDQQGATAAELKREIAFTCFMDADWRGMADWARESLDSACHGMTRVGALAALALAELGLGRLESVRRSVDEAVGLFDSSSDTEIAANHPGMAIWLGWAEICAERFEDAIRHTGRSIEISRTIGQRHLSVGLLSVRGQALALMGDGPALGVAAEAAVEAALMSASDLFLSWAMALRCQTTVWSGDLHAAVGFGERGMAAAGAAAAPQTGIARVLLASALLEIGEPERCRELLRNADSQPELPPLPFHESLCLELLTRAEIARGDLVLAEDCVVRSERVARRAGLRLPLALARRGRALMLLAQGDPRAAIIEAEASREAAERVKAPVEAGRSLTLAGVALAAAGDRDKAIMALERAHAQLRECGALHYGDAAARQLRKLGHAVPGVGRVKPSQVGLLGLSRRESEVMERISIGKTNREIAEALFVSVRTVDRHVSRIFDKLGVNSRAAASSVFERARAAQLVELRELRRAP